MAHFFLFDRPQSSGENSFQFKLQAAINLIKENNSLIAMLVLDVLHSNKVVIHSFYGLSQQHYFKMKKDMLNEDNISLPNVYPPSDAAVEMIESELNGIIYQDKYIYLCSTKSPQQIASTLVHEICHFLNAGLYDEDLKTNNAKKVGYHDEVRSFTAEKMFERNGHCLRRSDIKKIHKTVSELYPEFTKPGEDNSKKGYIFASYDSPLR